MVLGDLFTNFCNAVLSDKLGGLPIVSLNSGAPFLPYLNSWWAGSGRRMWLPAPLAYVSQTGSGYISPMVRLPIVTLCPHGAKMLAAAVGTRVPPFPTFQFLYSNFCNESMATMSPMFRLCLPW